MAKATKNNIPLLIIGLGGTGSDMAATIKRTFQDRFIIEDGSDVPPRTRFLIFDTDEKAKGDQGWSDGEFVHLNGDYSLIRNDLHPWERDWFDPEFSDPYGLLKGDGAGVFRQISRLYLFRNVATVLQRITVAVNELVQLSVATLASNPNNKPRIYVLAGISGGTGSGIFLDLAYLIRHSFGTNSRYELNCMLVLPDVTLQHHAMGNTILENLYCTNGYAALKELDFWMDYGTHQHQFRQKYAHDTIIEWNSRPYQFVYLLSSKNKDGNTITNAYNHVMQVVSEFMVSNFSDAQSVVQVIKQNKSENGTVSTEQKVLAHGTTIASQVSNYAAQYNQIRKEFPSPYIYSSIGAFSNSGDETDILNREWQLILTETVRNIDAEEHQPVMEGSDKKLVNNFMIDKIGRNGNDLAVSSTYMSYENRNPLGDFLNFSTTIKPQSLLQLEYDNSPHGSDFESFRDMINNRLANEKIELTKQMKDMAATWLQGIIKDYDKGPSYAYTVIQHPSQGLIAQLNAEKKAMENELNRCETYVHEYCGRNGKCESTVDKTKNRNLAYKGLQLILGQDKDIYVQDTIDLYKGQWKSVFIQAWQKGVDDLLIYLEKCSALLGDMVNGIRERKKNYDTEINLHQTATGIQLLNSEKVQQTLTSQFRDQQMDKALVIKAYDGIASAVTNGADEGLDDYSDAQIIEKLNDAIDGLRQDTFSEVNSQDVQSRLTAYAMTPGITMEEYTKDTLMPTLDRGACPMMAFSREAYSGKDVIETYIGTIPASATSIMQGINDYIGASQGSSSANVSISPIPDRIFWVRTLFGMPLNLLDQLNEYADAYQRTTHSGYHLCMSKSGGKSADLTNPDRQDWTLLPEPTCPRNRALFNREQEVEQLINDGFIELDVQLNLGSDGKKYIPDCHATWTRIPPIDQGLTRISVEQVIHALERIDEMGENVRIERCEAIKNSIQHVSLECDAVLAKIDAWKEIILDPTIAHALVPNIGSTEEAKKDYLRETKDAYRRVVTETVSRRPQLLYEMQVNKACIDKLEQALINYRKPDFSKLTLYGTYFAQMYRYGLLTTTNAIARFNIPDVDPKIQVFASLMDAEQMQKLEKGWFPGARGDSANGIEGYSALMYAIAVYVSQVAKIGTDTSIGLADESARKLLNQRNQELENHTIYGTQPDDISELKVRNNELLERIRAEKTGIQSKLLRNELKLEESELLEKILKGIMDDCGNFIRIWG